MAYIFGDGFDPYATTADVASGYWDTISGTSLSLVTGRFSGSRALEFANINNLLVKTSSVNDAVHHINIAHRQTSTLAGTNAGFFITLTDGVTNQCTIEFRQDGTIFLQSGSHGGTTLATYAGAVSTVNVWTAFEFEIVINNTTGSFKVRKNGNTVDDHSTTGINTRGGTANSYANKLQIGMNNLNTVITQFDDLLWRSDATSLAWLGDIRCFTRMPASDAAVQFVRSLASNTQTLTATAANLAMSSTVVRFTPYTMTYDGTISSVVAVSGGSASGNMKCAIYASAAGLPTTVLQSAVAPVVTVAAGNNTFTFSPPVAVTRGQQIFIAVINDTAGGSWSWSSSFTTLSAPGTYATFPQPNPAPTLGQNPIAGSITYNTSVNAGMVNETLQDGTTTYVYDATAGHADLYNFAALSPAPVTVHAVTTRGFVAKSDAGTRTGAMQLKSFAPAVTTWNPADKNAAIGLTGGNLTATSSAGSGSANCAVRATQAISATVKQYFEVTVTGTIGQYLSVGVMNAAASLSANIAQTNGVALVNNLFGGSTKVYLNGSNVTITAYPNFASGNVIRVAIDRAANKIWFAINNTPWTSGATPWMGSGGTTDDPATGTGGASISAVTGTIYPALGSAWTGDVAVLNGGTAAFAYTPPAGFAGVDITSTATTVASPTLSLSSSFLWAWRTDTLNPATSTAWTAAAVDAIQTGPLVVS